MQSHKVNKIMVPLSEYAMVSEDATLYEAVQELETAQKNFNKTPYKHRAVLIYDKNKKIIGKLTQLDVLKALEPRYYEMQGEEVAKSFVFSKQFMKSMLENLSLLNGDMANICKKAGGTAVRHFLIKAAEGEFIDIDASMDEAIHQMVLGQHQSLLVMNENGNIVGILKLTDVFSFICETMHKCGI